MRPCHAAAATSPSAFPVSIKGVVIRDGKVLLLKNERDEWELPGGKLDLGETPEACVAREILEEVGWQVEPETILDAWLYHIRQDRDVLIVTYGCRTGATHDAIVSHEHSAVGLFAEPDVARLDMPSGYKRSIRTWYARLRGSG